MEAFGVGDVVEFREPAEDEIGARFLVQEMNGDRCLVQFICDMTIRPTFVYRVADLRRAPADGGNR